MANDVLKTLYAIEEELEAIKAAKEQVEAAVAADAAINKSLKNYAEALSGLAGKFDLLKKGLDGVVAVVDDDAGKFSASLNACKSDIESATNKLSAILSEFKAQTEAIGIKSIADRTQQVQAVCEALKSSVAELVLKQQSSSEMLAKSIDNSVKDIRESTSNAKEILYAEINSKASDISSAVVSEGEKNRGTISEKSNEIVKKVTDAENSVNGVVREESARIEKLQKESEQKISEAVESADKKQTWLSVALIVAVCIDIVLQVLHFV